MDTAISFGRFLTKLVADELSERAISGEEITELLTVLDETQALILKLPGPNGYAYWRTRIRDLMHPATNEHLVVSGAQAGSLRSFRAGRARCYSEYLDGLSGEVIKELQVTRSEAYRAGMWPLFMRAAGEIAMARSCTIWLRGCGTAYRLGFAVNVGPMIDRLIKISNRMAKLRDAQTNPEC